MRQANIHVMSRRSKGSRRLLCAAVVAPCLAILPAQLALAQFPASNGDGHANDANNRVGSGGYNRPNGGPGITPNDIVYRNTTGLYGFHGAAESDPRAFQGAISSVATDRFIGESNAAPVSGTPSVRTTTYSVTPYYPDSRGVAPPPGFVPVIGGGGAVPTNSNQASTFSYQLPNGMLGNSLVTGAGYNTGAIDTPLNPTQGYNGPFAPYGTKVLPTDVNSDQTLLVSPLSGGQVINNPNENYNLTPAQLQQLGGQGRFPRMDQQALRQAQAEAAKSAEGQPEQPNPNQINNALPMPLEAPINKPTDATLGGGALGAQQLNSNGVQTQEGMYRTLTSAARQTPVLSALDQRLQAYRQHLPVDVQKEIDFEKAKSQAHPGQPAPGTTPLPGGTAGGPFVLPPTQKPDIGTSGVGTKSEPVHISSLAEGVHATALANFLKTAEDLMKQGKFVSAIEQYAYAQQVAPENPLIPLGLANAELGAGSYRSAETHLRQAFAGDEALLHAQFDLDALIGQQRVQTLTQDLKDLAAKDPRAEMPDFLLAYLSYNTRHEADAMALLQDAVKREGHPDNVIAKMLEHWYVPSSNSPKPATTGK